MKKKGLLVLLFALVCLLTVGCGKDKDEKGSTSNGVRVLECSQGDGETTLTSRVEQDKKTNEITKYTMTMVAPKDEYDVYGDSDDEIIENVCKSAEEDMKSKNCSAKIVGDKITISMEFNPGDFEEEITESEEYGISEIDENTFEKVKEIFESNTEDDVPATCKIS